MEFGVDIIFKIAGLGMLTAVITQVLHKCGREDIGTMVSLVSVILVLLVVINMVNDFFGTVKAMFMF